MIRSTFLLTPFLVAGSLLALTPGAPPAALAGIPLQDQRGRAVAPTSFGQGPVLVNFIFTRCGAACPRQVHEMVEVRRALPADVQRKVQFLSITVDPAHDTPSVLAAFARQMGAETPGWRFATGGAAKVTELLKRLQVMDPSKRQPQPTDHKLALYLFNAAGMPVIRYEGAPVDKVRLVEELTQLARLEQ